MLAVPALQPRPVVVSEMPRDLFAAEEGRVTDNGVETGLVCIGEHFGEGERPVKRPAGSGAVGAAALQIGVGFLAQEVLLAVDEGGANTVG